MTKGERFVYRGRERTVESVVRKSRQAGGSFDSYLSGEAPKYSPKEGECAVRILPPTWDDVARWGTGWDIAVHVHHNVGPDNGAYLCLDKMKGDTCPVCEARRSATDESEADQLKASARFLCWVIDRDNEKAGPMVWAMPITLFREINARSVDKKSNTPILIDAPDEGYDVVFNRTGTGIKTKYTAVEVARDPSPLHQDERQQKRWLDYIVANPLPEILNFFEADYIEKVLFGKAPARKTAEDVEAEEYSEPLPPSGQRRRPLEVDESEEDLDTEVRPSSRRLHTATPAEVDADADEDVEEQARSRLNRLRSRSAV